MEAEFHRLGGHMPREVTLIVIGGAAMVFQGTKPATKDIDVIIDVREDVGLLINTLRSSGYRTPDDLEPPYIRMGARSVLENDDGYRWDVFYASVREMQFTSSMKGRAEEWGRFGGFHVVATAPEDLFIFKALTDRERYVRASPSHRRSRVDHPGGNPSIPCSSSFRYRVTIP